MRRSFRVVPGLLREQRIECDDDHQKLMVNLLIIPLSTLQYRLVVALLRQRQRWEEDTQDHVPLVVPVAELQQVAGLRRKEDVKKHLWYASERLASQDLQIVSLRGFGYAIFHLSELLPAPSGAAPRPAVAAGVAEFRA